MKKELVTVSHLFGSIQYKGECQHCGKQYDGSEKVWIGPALSNLMEHDECPALKKP